MTLGASGRWAGERQLAVEDPPVVAELVEELLDEASEELVDEPVEDESLVDESLVDEVEPDSPEGMLARESLR